MNRCLWRSAQIIVIYSYGKYTNDTWPFSRVGRTDASTSPKLVRKFLLLWPFRLLSVFSQVCPQTLHRDRYPWIRQSFPWTDFCCSMLLILIFGNSPLIFALCACSTALRFLLLIIWCLYFTPLSRFTQDLGGCQTHWYLSSTTFLQYGKKNSFRLLKLWSLSPSCLKITTLLTNVHFLIMLSRYTVSASIPWPNTTMVLNIS